MYDSKTMRIVRGTIVGVLIAVALIFFLFPIYWIVLASFKTKIETTSTGRRCTSSSSRPTWTITRRSSGSNRPVKRWRQPWRIPQSAEEQLHHRRRKHASGGTVWHVDRLCDGAIQNPGKERHPVLHPFQPHASAGRRDHPDLPHVHPARTGADAQGLILMYTTINLPFVVWMMKGFFDEIPHEYEDAAMLDGYPRIQAFCKVTMPKAWPGMAATAVFCLITAWNEYVFAFILNSQPYASTVPSFIASKSQGTAGTPWEHASPRWRRCSSAGVHLHVPGPQSPAARRHLRRGAPLTTSEEPWMASVTVEKMTKRFGEVVAVRELDLQRRGPRIHGVPRSVRLRQDDDAALIAGLERQKAAPSASATPWSTT